MLDCYKQVFHQKLKVNNVGRSELTKIKMGYF